jgi:hypothetical protein
VAERGDVDRHRRTLRLVEQLQRLAEAEPLVGGKRQGEDLAVVPQGLAAKRGPDDVDDLAGPAQRLVVGHPVPALDHLGAGGAEPEDRPAAADVVEPGGGLRERTGRAGEHVEDRSADLDAFGLGGQVAHQRGGVEAVGLGHPDGVQPGRLERRDLVGCLARVAGVRQRGGELHGTSSRGRQAITLP